MCWWLLDNHIIINTYIKKERRKKIKVKMFWLIQPCWLAGRLTTKIKLILCCGWLLTTDDWHSWRTARSLGRLYVWICVFVWLSNNDDSGHPRSLWMCLARSPRKFGLMGGVDRLQLARLMIDRLCGFTKWYTLKRNSFCCQADWHLAWPYYCRSLCHCPLLMVDFDSLIGVNVKILCCCCVSTNK